MPRKQTICPRSRYLLPLVLVSLGVFAPGAPSAEPARWHTGRQLNQVLDAQVDMRLSGSSLQSALRRLSETQRVAVFLDRRVDPNQKIDLALSGVPLRAALEKIAADRGLGFTLLGSVAYLGPPAAAEELRTLAELARVAAKQLPRDSQRIFFRQEAWNWEALSTPQELMAALSEQSGIEIRQRDRVPHDLWAAGDFPPLSLIDRLSLLGVGFGLTFEIAADGKAIILVPIRSPVRLVRDYGAGANPGQVAEKLSQYLPEAEFKVARGRLFVRGLLELHERVQAALRGEPIRRPASGPGSSEEGITLVSLKVQNQPVGPVLRQIAERFQLQLKIDQQAIDDAGLSLERLVSFEVNRVTIDKLLEATLQPAGLAFRRSEKGKVVEVFPAMR